MPSTVNKNDNNKNTSTTEKNETDIMAQRIKQNVDILHAFKKGNLDAVKRYSGFGGLRNAFKDAALQAELAAFLSSREIERLRKSASTGYFTPAILVDFIYGLVQRLGFTHGKILEPACGHGAFFERMPQAMREQSDITGVELEPLSAAMAKALYPDIKILNQGFHHFHDNEFDLIIGNPPYAPFPVFDKQHSDLSDEMIHHYFVAKSVRLLKEGGLLAMVVPCYVLDNPRRHLRHEIADVADLVAAYRMPADLFDDAKITVDVVVFQRSATPKKDWLDTLSVELSDKTRVRMAKYFIDHPAHVIGELSTYEAYSFFEDRMRKGLKSVASLEDVKKRLPQFLESITPEPKQAT